MDDRDAYYGNEDHGVILDFLRGGRPDWEGRWLADVRSWTDDQLEDDHHYIQWLFPLTTESEAVFAPVMRRYEVAEFVRDDRLQREMIESLRRLLAFYGFMLDADCDRIIVAPTRRHEEC